MDSEDNSNTPDLVVKECGMEAFDYDTANRSDDRCSLEELERAMSIFTGPVFVIDAVGGCRVDKTTLPDDGHNS